MIEINIHEAKTHLSKHLNRLKPGERIILCKRHVPVAEIRLLEPKQEKKRVIGLAKGQFTVPPSFFEPLPTEVLEGFYSVE
ncbi:MAG: type II toxin-antitoxin system Phd/YefM family antitoxin [Myxococcota bacterium]|nr:type II toxin-antitoxin system Phd/YefM family antitoxin [Myxococcota bacterium]